jgi:hypothetical protein
VRTSAAASDIALRTSARCSAAWVRDARRNAGGSVRLVSLECLEVVPAPIREVATQERVPLEPGRRSFAAIHLRVQLVGHRVTASLVLPAVNRGTVVSGEGGQGACRCRGDRPASCETGASASPAVRIIGGRSSSRSRELRPLVCQRGSKCPCLRGASIIAAARFCQLRGPANEVQASRSRPRSGRCGVRRRRQGSA